MVAVAYLQVFRSLNPGQRVWQPWQVGRGSPVVLDCCGIAAKKQNGGEKGWAANNIRCSRESLVCAVGRGIPPGK